MTPAVPQRGAVPAVGRTVGSTEGRLASWPEDTAVSCPPRSRSVPAARRCWPARPREGTLLAPLSLALLPAAGSWSSGCRPSPSHRGPCRAPLRCGDTPWTTGGPGGHLPDGDPHRSWLAELTSKNSPHSKQTLGSAHPARCTEGSPRGVSRHPTPTPTLGLQAHLPSASFTVMRAPAPGQVVLPPTYVYILRGRCLPPPRPGCGLAVLGAADPCHAAPRTS